MSAAAAAWIGWYAEDFLPVVGNSLLWYISSVFTDVFFSLQFLFNLEIDGNFLSRRSNLRFVWIVVYFVSDIKLVQNFLHVDMFQKL